MVQIIRFAEYSFSKLVFAAGVFSSLEHTPAIGDTLVLKNGTVVEGRCLNATDKNATAWHIETEDGLQLTVGKEEVKSIRPLTAEQKAYAEIIAKIGTDDSLEVHRNFVDWCAKKGLLSLADAHYQRIVELDATNKSAWAALEYDNTEQGWTRRDVLQKRRGLQQKGTRWYVPQDLAIQTANEQFEKSKAQVSKEVAKRVADVRTNSAKAGEARQYLAQLRDPLAVSKIQELLEKDRNNSNTAFRSQMVEILGRIRSAGSVKALIASAISDPDTKIRSECVAHLSEFGSETAIQSFLLLLTNKQPEKDNPEIYDRVGDAFAVLGDERCIARLLDCLVTDHVIVPPPKPGVQAAQQGNGNVNFVQGNPKPEKKRINNEGILSALHTISKNENFGYDVQAWRNWYATTYGAPNPYVLRDP